MTQIETSLRNTKQSARRLRFEQVSPFTATDTQTAIQQAGAAAAGGTAPPALTPTPVDATASPYTILGSDYLVEVDTSAGPVTVVAPAAASRNNVGFYVKDIAGSAGTNAITVSRSAADTIDGFASYPINVDFGSAFFQPKTGGYAVL